MDPFVYNALPGRVIFGSGTLARVGDEMAALGFTRAMLLSTAGRRGDLAPLEAQLGERVAGVFAGAAMHTPVAVTAEALAATKACGADCLIALGGGSTTGLSKAIALRTDLPQIVIPTTYAGSEASPILGETRDGVKTTQRSMRVLPEVIVYDVDLTLSLPPAMAVVSGINAIAHAAEGLYAPNANPMISMLAEDGVRALARALPAIVADAGDRGARSDALYGAWACGVTLGAVAMGLHHKLCHVLGGSFGLPHAETHTVILPHALAYNASAAPEAMTRLARALGASDAPAALFDLAKSLGAPVSLKALGMPEDGLSKVVDQCLAAPPANPRALEHEALMACLQDAFDGRRP